MRPIGARRFLRTHATGDSTVRPMRSLTVPVIITLVSLAACGTDSSSTESDDSAPTVALTAPADTETTESATTESATTDPPPDEPVETVAAAPTEPPADAAPTTTPPSTLPEPAPWDGPRFDEAIEPTMAALAVGVGQPLSAAAVAPEIVLPAEVPTPGGTIIGAGWASEFDLRRDEYGLEYAVGLDAAITPDELLAWQEGVGDGWQAASFAESGSFYTSLVTDEQGQRLVHLLDTDASANGRPPLNLEWSPDTTSLFEPDWLDALPRPDGGVTSELLVARGDVTVGLGAAGLDGQVFVRFDYEVDDLDRMIDYFEAGTLLGAGFEYEPVPISNGRYRRDVSIGDWSGDVLIGEASSNDVDYLQVIWNLTRDVRTRRG